ncbi:MAG: hypothetical protein BGP24_04055 [Lysobacterales bacterium 69-70]|nr:MAG: hypothetical protein ABS97_18310 [Xanthomonadaceae bacterium SCN 69-320]ODV19041.1 MAG: hypothetical protein ABT27_12465 [Xanthomonadaceae bacterium SCN 69-25]OJZ01903.1 MAG: hypothetical protein BGP24_04055 [Xanthomonadales bacterium 69-70]
MVITPDVFVAMSTNMTAAPRSGSTISASFFFGTCRRRCGVLTFKPQSTLPQTRRFIAYPPS